MQKQANVVEVFSSIQGEGLYVGCRQIFVRLAGCNLQCAYCDTPASQKRSIAAQIELTAGQRNFETLYNPISVSTLVEKLEQLLTSPHHSISFTGGEPLCQAEIIAEIASRLEVPIYLETNGTLFQELEHILPYIDFISMDIKLPSTGETPCWDEHRRFLAVAKGKKVFVKIVITANTTLAEFDQAIQLVQEAGFDIPVILQPVTPNQRCQAPAPEMMLLLQARALDCVQDVRVIPQTHKFMGQL